MPGGSPGDNPAAPLRPSNVSEDDALHTCYAMLALVTLVILSRVVVHLIKRKTFEAQDFFIYFAYVAFVAFWSLYVALLGPLKKVNGLTKGTVKPYPTVIDDLAFMAKRLWTAQLVFYLCVYSVKLSLLCLYRKLLKGMPKVYNRIWWSIFIFCIVCYIGTSISSVTSCRDIGAFLSRAQCGGNPDEDRRSAISLNLGYGLDVLTDLMVMALPIRLLWNLQMPRREKLGVGVLFSSGFVCIFFATLRIVQIGFADGKSQAPKPEWQIIWTVTEASTAMIIGCAPAFALAVRGRLLTRPSYDSKGYIKHSPSDDINLRTIGSSSSRPKPTAAADAETDGFWSEQHGSREELAKTSKLNGHEGGIVVTTTLHQEEEGASKEKDRPMMVRKIPERVVRGK